MESRLTIDLNNLTDTERQAICNVLKRDDDLRRRDEQRIQRLKSELQWLRRRGAIRGGVDPMTSCARCRCKLGKIINRGSPCPVCKVAKVCKACRVYARDGVHWFCVVCHKQLVCHVHYGVTSLPSSSSRKIQPRISREIEAATGEWMNEFMRRASRHKDRKGVPPVDIVRETISRKCSFASASPKDDKAIVSGNHGGQKRVASAAVAIAAPAALNRDPRRTPSLMDRQQQQPYQGKIRALSPSVSPELSLPPSPEISRSPRSPPRDRISPAPPSPHHRTSPSPPVPSPRQKSPLLKQRAIVSDQDHQTVAFFDESEPPRTATPVPSRRGAPPHHPSDRSDSGIGADSATTPLTPRSPRAPSTYSESVHSRQSSSCSSSGGGRRIGGIGSGDASWSFRTTTTTTTNESVATDSISEPSDLEVEPSTKVVFRKVSLKRRKNKDGRHASYGQSCPPVVDKSSSPLPSSSSSSIFPRHPEPYSDPLKFRPGIPRADPVPVPVAASERTNDDDDGECGGSRWWTSGDVTTTADCRAAFLRSFLTVGDSNEWPTPRLSRSLEEISTSSSPPSKDLTALGSSWTSSAASGDGRWNDIWLDDSAADYEEDVLPDCCSGDGVIVVGPTAVASDSCSDILCNVSDKIVPGGSEYRIVFISSSSSSSSSSDGCLLNSGGGGCEECPSSPASSVQLIDDDDDDNGDWEATSTEVMAATVAADTSPLPPPLPLAPPPALPPGFSPVDGDVSIDDGYDVGDVACIDERNGDLRRDVSELASVDEGESDDDSESGLGTLFSDEVDLMTTASTSATEKCSDKMDATSEEDVAADAIPYGNRIERLVADVSVKGADEDVLKVQVEPEVEFQLESEVEVKAVVMQGGKVEHEVNVEPEVQVEPKQDLEAAVKLPAEQEAELKPDVDAGVALKLEAEQEVKVVPEVGLKPVVEVQGDRNVEVKPEVEVKAEVELEVRFEQEVNVELAVRETECREEMLPAQVQARPIADLHRLVAQSRALRDNGGIRSSDRRQLEESSKTSVLEKYFVTTLEQTTPSLKSGRLVHRLHPLTRNSVLTPPPVSSADDEDNEPSSEGDVHGSFESEDDDDESTTDDDEDSETTPFDDSDDSQSTLSTTSSSDEGTVYLKSPTAVESAAFGSAGNDLDMSLHTIVEESCEESESERPAEERRRNAAAAAAQTADPSQLERYYRYTFGGNGNDLTTHDVDDGAEQPTTTARRPKDALESLFSDDGLSDTGSSCFSENDDDVDDDELARLASSRLEKYFLTGFLGMDGTFGLNAVGAMKSASSTTTTTITPDGTADEVEEVTPFEKNDGCDTIKRKSKRDASRSENADATVVTDDCGLTCEDANVQTKDIVISEDVGGPIEAVSQDLVENAVSSFDVAITPNPTTESDAKWDDTKPAVLDSPYLGVGRSLNLDWKQQSRDSGFIGSSDDLLIRERELEEDDDGDVVSVDACLGDTNEGGMMTEPPVEAPSMAQISSAASNRASSATATTTTLSAVSSSSSIFGQFRGSARSTRSNRSVRSNVCTSDDEAQYIVNQLVTHISKSMSRSPQPSRAKPPEIEVFEEELTKLMRSVPGIDATVKELVEELSSTDYCSDSYESSESYASDHEQTTAPFEVHHRMQPTFQMCGASSLLRRNDSWRSSTSTASKTSSLDGGQLSSEETAFIYRRFMDSLTKMAEHAASDDTESSKSGNGKNSPPTFAKIVTHIRDKVTSLMRGGGSDGGDVTAEALRNGHRGRIVWRKPGSGCGDELSSISSTTSSMAFDDSEGDDDGLTDTEPSIDSDDPTAMTSAALAALDDVIALGHRAKAEALSGLTTPTGVTTPDGDDDDADGLERWNSDMTIVDGVDDGSDVTRLAMTSLTSVHKSEPMLSMPDAVNAGVVVADETEDKRHSLSFDNRLASRIGNAGFPLNTLQQRHRSVDGCDDDDAEPLSSSSSLMMSSKDAKEQRKCRSEWEMWKASDLTSPAAAAWTSSSQDSVARQTHKSCDPLPSVRCKTEPKTTTTTTQQGLYHRHAASASKDRSRRHGLTTFIWRQKSGSSTSLRAEASETKHQIQYRSSHQLQSVAKKKDDLHQQQQQRYHWPFGNAGGSGHKHKDCSSRWSTSVKSCLSSPESLSGVGVDGITTTTTSSTTVTTSKINSVSLDTFDGDSVGVRLLSHRSLDPTTTATSPYPLGHRTMPMPSSSSSAHKMLPSSSSSLSVDPQPPSSSSSSWAKASTLPRAAAFGCGPSDLSFVPNASFLHKSNRSLLMTTATTAAANNKYSRLVSSHPHPRPHPDPHSWSWTTAPSSSGPVPEQDLYADRTHTQRPVPPIAAPRHSSSSSTAASVPRSATTTPAANPESPKFRREVRSWPDENSPAPAERPTRSAEPSQRNRGGGGGGHRSKAAPPPPPTTTTMADEMPKYIPNISVVEYSEKNSPRGTGSHGGSSADEDIDRLVALHKNRSLSSLGVCSESMSSVYSAAGGGHYGNVMVRGEVEFGLGYNYVSGALEVSIKQCRDLASVDVKRNRSDPYVKVYLLPDKSKSGKRKTRVKKHTLNPTFNEVLKFNVTISELETRTLWLTVWHSDMFGRNEFLGEVTLPMGYEAFDDSSPKWYLLQERLGPIEEVFSYKGDLVVALRFVPPDVTNQKKGQSSKKGSLHVLVREARNLMAVSANGTSDPFCKCYLLPDRSKSNKQKTPVVKRSCHPKWNHTFVYDDVSLESLLERCLEITVWDYDRLTSNDFLGGVRLSLGTGKYQGKRVDWMDSRGEEVSVWQTVLERPNVWVDSSLLLRPTMDHRQTSTL